MRLDAISCRFCGEEFKPYTKTQTVCGSPGCRRKLDNERHKSKGRVPHIIKCPDCGGTFAMDSKKAIRCNACAHRKVRREIMRRYRQKYAKRRDTPAATGMEKT